jgi:hypothetical protein
MKKFLLIFPLILFTSVTSASAYICEWGFTPPTAPAVTAYRLYKNKVKVVDFPGATTTQGEVKDGAIVYGDSFTLTALFSDGTESPESSPYVWKEGPKIIRIVK